MATKNGNGIEPTMQTKPQAMEDFELQQLTKLEIQIEAKDLHSTDIGDPDPFCVVKEVRKDMLGTVVVGRTEKISNTKCPVFKKPILVSYLFEEDQVLEFSVYDFDYVGGNDLIGEVSIDVSELVKDQQKEIEMPLEKKQRSTGLLKLHVDIIPPLPPQTFSLKFSTFLPKKFISPNSYMVLDKIRSDKTKIEVYESEKQKHTTSPVWTIKDVKQELLYTNDDSELKFSVFSASPFGKYKFNGSFQITFDQLIGKEARESERLTLKKSVMVKSTSMVAGKDSFDDKGTGTHSKIKDTGNVMIEMIDPSKQKHDEKDYYTFVADKKIKLKIHVAIDFTASNGKYDDLTSLHTITGSGNKYVEVLKRALPGLLNQYTDPRIAAFGFGAKLKSDTETSHCFALNGNEKVPEVNGLDDLLNVYKSKLKEIELSGPTVFSKLIKNVAVKVQQGMKENDTYNILLIITDGVICDREATIDSIVYASYLPLSIVIVGVGDADFTDMRRLDGDLQPLKNGRNQRMARDIVQFVSLKTINKNTEAAEEFEKEFFTKAIHREIPEHIIEYYDKHKEKIEDYMKDPYKNIQWWSY